MLDGRLGHADGSRCRFRFFAGGRWHGGESNRGFGRPAIVPCRVRRPEKFLTSCRGSVLRRRETDTPRSMCPKLIGGSAVCAEVGRTAAQPCEGKVRTSVTAPPRRPRS